MDIETGILNEVLRENQHSNWILLWSLALLIGFVLTRRVYPRYWMRYRQAMIFSMEAEKLLKEKNINLLQTAVFLNFLGSLSIALFLFLSLTSFSRVIWPGNSVYDLLIFSGLLVLLTGLRYASIEFLGITMKNRGLAARMNHSWLIHLKNFGFFLLLIAILISFFPDTLRNTAIITGFFVLLIMQIMNYLRGFQILFQERISIFYGILYLCTLEILPILVIVRTVIV